MATQKPKSTPKAKPAVKNTSAAAAPGNSVDVSAAEAVKAASAAIAPQAGQISSDEAKGIPPAGAAKAGGLIAKEFIISAKSEGFRRAGRRWTVEPQTVPADEFDLNQVEALLSEPMLDVVVVAE